MIKIIQILFYILLSFWSIYAQKTTYITVAVSDFAINSSDGTYNWLGASVTQAMIEDLSQSRYIRLVERKYLNTILEEISLQLSGIVDESSAIQVGNLLGANVFIFGNLSFLNDQIIIQARAVSVDGGEIIANASTRGFLDNIFNLQNEISRKIASSLAVEATFTHSAHIPSETIKVSTYKRLREIEQLSKQLPILGLDPSRKENQGKYYIAISELNTIIKEIADFSPAYLLRSSFYLQLEDFQKTEEDLHIASNILPDIPQTVYALGNVNYVQGNYVEAEQYFTQYTQEISEDSYGWYALGKVYIKSMKNLQASAAFLKSALLYPFPPEAEENLKTLLRSPAEKEILSYLNNSTEGLFDLAQLYMNYWNNDLNKLPAIIDVIQLNYPEFYLTYYIKGRIDLEINNLQAAIQSFRKSLALNPTFPPVHRELGKALVTMNDKLSGRNHLRIYLSTANYIDDYSDIRKYLTD